MAKGGRYGKAPTENQVKEAVSVIQRDYYADVQGVVDELEGLVKRGGISTREQADDWIHKTIDGHGRVIYTWQAKLGLLASENEDAYEDQTGETGADTSARMYWAMRADVEEAVERSDFISKLED